MDEPQRLQRRRQRRCQHQQTQSSYTDDDNDAVTMYYEYDVELVDDEDDKNEDRNGTNSKYANSANSAGSRGHPAGTTHPSRPLRAGRRRLRRSRHHGTGDGDVEEEEEADTTITTTTNSLCDQDDDFDNSNDDCDNDLEESYEEELIIINDDDEDGDSASYEDDEDYSDDLSTDASSYASSEYTSICDLSTIHEETSQDLNAERTTSTRNSLFRFGIDDDDVDVDDVADDVDCDGDRFAFGDDTRSSNRGDRTDRSKLRQPTDNSNSNRSSRSRSARTKNNALPPIIRTDTTPATTTSTTISEQKQQQQQHQRLPLRFGKRPDPCDNHDVSSLPPRRPTRSAGPDVPHAESIQSSSPSSPPSNDLSSNSNLDDSINSLGYDMTDSDIQSNDGNDIDQNDPLDSDGGKCNDGRDDTKTEPTGANADEDVLLQSSDFVTAPSENGSASASSLPKGASLKAASSVGSNTDHTTCSTESYTESSSLDGDDDDDDKTFHVTECSARLLRMLSSHHRRRSATDNDLNECCHPSSFDKVADSIRKLVQERNDEMRSLSANRNCRNVRLLMLRLRMRVERFGGERRRRAFAKNKKVLKRNLKKSQQKKIQNRLQLDVLDGHQRRMSFDESKKILTDFFEDKYETQKKTSGDRFYLSSPIPSSRRLQSLEPDRKRRSLSRSFSANTPFTSRSVSRSFSGSVPPSLALSRRGMIQRGQLSKTISDRNLVGNLASVTPKHNVSSEQLMYLKHRLNADKFSGKRRRDAYDRSKRQLSPKLISILTDKKQRLAAIINSSRFDGRGCALKSIDLQ